MDTCSRGHEMTEENTYRWRGHRRCRKCNVINVQAYRRRAAEALREKQDQERKRLANAG